MNVDPHLWICMHSLFQAHDLPGLQLLLPSTVVIYQIIDPIKEANIPPWECPHAFAGPTMTTMKVNKAIPRLPAFCRLLPPAFVRLPMAMQAAEGSQLMCDTDARSLKVCL